MKDSKKKVEKVIDSILKEFGMSRKEFDEVKGIAMEMKASGQTKILTPTPIVVVRPTEEVTVSQTSVQTPSMPYVVVSQQQQPRKLVKTKETSVSRKYTRIKMSPKRKVK